MQIETKYNFGDVVWWASTQDGTTSMPCPECGGAGRLKVASLIDAHRTVNCPTCAGSGAIRTYAVKPYVRELTLAQVRITRTCSPGLPGMEFWSNYAAQNGGDEWYMAVETGVGSGSLYPAEYLYTSREAAEARAAVLVAEAEAQHAELRAEDERRRQREAEKFAAEEAAEDDL